MSIATLQDIIAKIRKLTVTSNSSQLTDSQIIDYINSYYIYDFPAQFRSLKLKDVYVFNTTQGVDTYPFDYNNWSTIEGPCYCEKIPIQLYQSPNGFRGINFNWQTVQVLAQGNGTAGAITGDITAITNAANASVTSANHGLVTGNVILISDVLGMTEVNGQSFTITFVDVNTFLLNVDSTAFGVYGGGGDWLTSAYSGTLTSSPILRSANNNPAVESPLTPNQSFPSGVPVSFSPSALANYPNISRVQNLLITANISNGTTLHVTDNGYGILIGDCTNGIIDYQTGIISELTFSQAIPSGNDINVQYIPYVANIPQSIMFYQNQFTLRPVPDKGYTVEVTAYRLPSQALLGTINPDTPNLNGVPEMREWWEVICFGVSKKIYQDRIDNEGVATMDAWLQEALLNAETRTYAQLGKQRTATIYGDQSNNAYGNGNGNAFGWGGGAGLGF